MTFKFITRAIAIAAIATASHAAFAAISYTQNFESPEVTGNNNNGNAGSFAENTGGLVGWLNTGGNNLTLAEAYSLRNSTANGQFLFLTGGTTATYTLTGLSIGQTYSFNVSFDYAGYRNGNAANQTVAGTFAAASGGSSIVSTHNLVEDTDNNQNINTYFAHLGPAGSFNGSFTAGNTNAVFTFTALGGESSKLAIDNFSATVTAVPEPETYAMMLTGLGAIGFMARRRQRQR